MSALLDERSKRQKSKLGDRDTVRVQPKKTGSADHAQNNLKSLVESVKRKSAAVHHGVGKRRKL